MLLKFYILLGVVFHVNCSIWKSCKREVDYLFPWYNSNCFDDADMWKDTLQIVKNYNRTLEQYSITTEDGYILTLFRLPAKKSKGTIVLMHPLSSDSVIWVSHRNTSIAFLLSDLNYDVWMPNMRGTPFSNKHVNLTTADPKYWNFTFHELGVYDYSASLQFIHEKINSTDIIVIGHSMGGTEALVYASMKPEEASKLTKLFILVNPTSIITDFKSVLSFIIPIYLHLLWPVLRFFKIHQFLRYNSLESRVLFHMETLAPFKFIYEIPMALFCGGKINQFEPDLLNLIFSINPRGTSFKMLTHYSQLIEGPDRFRMFNYGKKTNTKYYNSTTPPLYPLQNILTPIYGITGTEDNLSTDTDMKIFYDKLLPQAKIFGYKIINGASHLTIFMGKDRQKVIDPIFKIIESVF